MAVGRVAALTAAYGEPFSVKGFGQFISSAIRAAGLPDRCKAHGLPKAAARRLAEVGGTTASHHGYNRPQDTS